jgi:hypothetical protein
LLSEKVRSRAWPRILPRTLPSANVAPQSHAIAGSPKGEIL